MNHTETTGRFTQKFRPVVFCMALMLSSAPAQAAGLRIEVTGPAEPVFTALKDRCEQIDIPDAPARAFRDADGMVHLFATHYVNRALIGKDFKSLKHDCKVVYQGSDSDKPAAFDDRGWLASFYTTDGKSIFALVHNEFQGNLRPSLCPSKSYLKCWYNSIVMVTSDDGGYSFQRPRDSRSLVASVPYPYVPDLGKKIGASSPSNIVELNGKFYFLFLSDTPVQSGAICLARTDKLADPNSWRAWNGRNFDVPMFDPYTDKIENPDASVCTHLSNLAGGSVGSLTRHQPTGLFVLTQTVGGPNGGLYYATSPDLLHWSRPQMLWKVPTYRPTCGTEATFGYPSIIDHASASRSFETIVGDSATLYVNRNHVEANCNVAWNRDLVRVPIRLDVLP